ncbi:MAG: restriction endonuclease subunit S, partial [Candidatus Latescibacterota bacterium]
DRGSRPYPAYRDSRIEWLGRVPEHWGVQRLKYLAAVRPSNVDKQAVEGQAEVRLCNYVDVYKNERITDDLDFMPATATDEQIRAFQLRADDVLITKDSESRTDIAVPAHVTAEMPGVVCGYHLAVLRPRRERLRGDYLFWLLSSRRINHQFAVAANGITRFGLSTDAITGAWLPCPDVAVQQAIAAFLDRETARIDALVEKKQRLIELLREKRQAVITRAVTRGLEPDAPMKDSGIEWLGAVPAPWRILELRCLSRPGTLITYGIVQAGPHVDGGIPYIRTSDMAGESLARDGYLRTSPEIADHYARSCVAEGDLVIAIRATVGKVLPVPAWLTGANLTQGTAKFSPGPQIRARFALYAFTATTTQQRLEALAKGATFREITLDMLRRLAVALPPLSEQASIGDHLDSVTMRIDALISKLERSIALLSEHRQALITAAVTGQIHVRDEVPA